MATTTKNSKVKESKEETKQEELKPQQTIEEFLALNKGRTKKVESELSDIAGLRQRELEVGPFTLRYIKFSNNSKEELPLISKEDDEYKENHIVPNALQLKSQDPARCAVNHLLTILYELAGVSYKQAKEDNMTTRGNAWLLLTKKDDDVAGKVERSADAKVARLFGFEYNTELRTATYYRNHANVDELAKLPTNKIQQVYDDMVDAAEKSHMLHSHNNQFSNTTGQKSAWLLEINKTMKDVAKKLGYEESKGETVASKIDKGINIVKEIQHTEDPSKADEQAMIRKEVRASGTDSKKSNSAKRNENKKKTA